MSKHQRMGSLPTELILVILRWSIHIPGSLSTSFDSLFGYHRQLIIGRSHQATEARRTKLALLRVCKSWCLMGRELMFECISVGPRPALGETIEVLQGVPLEYRCRTRRLDVNARSLRSSSDADYDIVRPLLRLLTLFPNLEILHITGAPSVPREGDIESLVNYIKLHLPHLKYVSCYDGMNWSRIARNRDRIAPPYISIHGMQSFSGFWANNDQLMSIENNTLTTLMLTFERSTDFPLQGLKLPALRNFGAHKFSDRQPGLLSFLDTHGPQITSISLYCELYQGRMEYDILDRCTSLKEIIYSDTPRANIPSSEPYMNISRLGLTGDPSCWRHQCIDATYFLTLFPNLELVRLLSIEYSSPPQRYTQMVVENLFTSRRGVAFQDAIGVPIPASSSNA